MDIIFEPNGNFNEVYLYVSFMDLSRDLILTPTAQQEELMEADLHAIVRYAHKGYRLSPFDLTP